MNSVTERGLTAAQARILKYGLIGLCLVDMIFIFQPVSQTLFSVGCVGVVVGGLVFNLVPLCVPGARGKDIARAGAIVVIIFIVVVLLALASAWLYGIYLRASM